MDVPVLKWEDPDDESNEAVPVDALSLHGVVAVVVEDSEVGPMGSAWM